MVPGKEGWEREMRKTNEVEEQLPSHQSRCCCLLVNIYPSSSSPLKGVLCLTFPSPALNLCRENEFEEGG